MDLRNSYYYFESALSADFCKRIKEAGLVKIKKMLSNNESVYATTFGDNSKHNIPNGAPKKALTTEQIKKLDNNLPIYVRDSKVAWLNDQWIYDEILPYVHRANKEAGWHWQIDGTESFQFTVYDNNGFYGWHKDGGSDHFAKYKRYMHGLTPVALKENGNIPAGYVVMNNMVDKVRKISLTINLNEPTDYEGGNLMFDFGHHTEGERFHECKEIRPQGSIIVFPSFLDHCVTPVTKGTRYSLVLWCLGDPFK